MIVRYVPYDGELVSRAWHIVLTHMAADGVDFHVNEGHRTLERQGFFWSCGPNGCCCCNNCNLAARPSPFAPHIRTGRADHAVDFGGDIDAVLRWLTLAGLKPTRPAGAGTSRWEPWHVEVSLPALLAYARKHKQPGLATLPKHVEHAARLLINQRKTVKALVESRDSISSRDRPAEWTQRNERVQVAGAKRSKYRTELVRLLHRSEKETTKRILRDILVHDH